MLFLLNTKIYFVFSQEVITCDKYCPTYLIGNNNCDMDCMTPNCNFDSNLYSSDRYLNFKHSDCFFNCTCDEVKLTNGVCDTECNKFECGYDLGECWFCAPKCELSFRGNEKCEKMCYNSDCNYDDEDCNCNIGCFDTSGECLTSENFTDPCDSEYCGYKDGKCGYCASGCFEDNLGDGICQPQCNKKECNYDSGDCECAPGCGFKYNQTLEQFIQTGNETECSFECLVLECRFGVDFCNNITSIKIAVLNYLIIEGEYRESFFHYCFECTTEMINLFLDEKDSCTENSVCDNKYCLHCMGRANKTFENCLSQTFDKCLVCDSTMVERDCYKDLNECPYGYENITILSEIFGCNTWCLRKAEYYSKSSYNEVYIDHTVLSNGKGTKDEPLKSLYSGLVNVYAAYTKIYLLNKDINFFVDKTRSIFISDLLDPLNTNDNFKTHELWIIGNFSETVKTVIYWKDNLKITPKAQKFYIKNIEFNGKYVLDNQCIYKTCFYCPYVDIKTGLFPHDDRGDLVEMYNYTLYYSKNCSSYGSVNVFNFSSQVFIETVDFTDFRYQYNSFIKSSSALTLKNVNFSKMQAKSEGSIILLECITISCFREIDCKNICYNSAFTYNQGQVIDIGEGYHDFMSVGIGSFLVSSNIGKILITNVNFSYNFVFNNLRSDHKGYLIFSKNHLGTINIEDCNFRNNYVNYLVYIDISSLVYTDYKLDKGIGKVFSQQHFFMNNINITDTYCSHGLLYYLMLDTLHNINVTNIIIDKSVVGPNGIFSFINEGTLQNSEINGDYFINIIKLILNSDILEYIYFEPRHLHLENIVIKNLHLGKHSLYIKNLPNSWIKNLSIYNISDGTADNIQTIIDLFKENDKKRYFSFIDEDSEVPILNCNEMVLITDSVNLNIDLLNISDIKCKNEELTLGLHLKKISGITNISKLFITDIQNQARSGNALEVLSCNIITITDLGIFDVSNLLESIVTFENCNKTIIDSARIERVKSNYASTFFVSNIKYFALKNFFFNDMSSEYDNGGCLYLLTGMLESSFKIESGNFTQCKSKNGKGGAVFLDSKTRVVSTLLEISDVWISKCFSYEASAVYISSSVLFNHKNESMMFKLQINNNDCEGGGVISDYHYAGILKIDQIELFNNSRGIYAFYSNSYPKLFIMNTKVFGSDTMISLVYLNSLMFGSFVYFKNVEFFNAQKVCIEASRIKIIIDQMQISNSYQAIYFSEQVECEATRLNINNVDKSITIVQNAYFSCNSCEFWHNTNLIIEASSGSYFRFMNSSIYSNTLDNGNLISILSANLEVSVLINCQIHSNSIVSGSLIYIFSSIFNIKDCLIFENNAHSTIFQAIYSYNSILNIKDSRFKLSGLLEYDALIYAVTKSIITIDNTAFESIKSIIGSIYVNNVNLTINNCKFYENTGSDIISVKSALVIADSIFENSFMTDSNLGLIVISNSILTKIERSFFKIQPALIKLIQYPINKLAYVNDEFGKKLDIFDCNFKGLSNSIMAIFVKETISVFIKNSNISEFNTEEFSALTMISNGNGCELAIINSCIIENWSANNGGAIYSESYSLTIENTEMSWNQAKDSGGAIYFVSTFCDSCGIYLTGTTSIFNNSCRNDGGAIKWKDFKPYIENTVSIFNNSALYGPNFASVPSKFGLHQGRSLSDLVITTITNVPPGKKFTDYILVSIYDTYGQVIETENSMIITLSVNETVDYPTAISGIRNFKAQNGTFNLTDFILTGKPGSITYLKLKSENEKIVSVRNDDSEYSDSAFIQVELRNCTKGEQIQEIACVDCSRGKYSLQASESCLECPTGAFCPGGSALIVKNGYWRSSLESDVIYLCDVQDACIKGTESNELGNCSQGYSKALCKSCEIGYSKTANGICTKCPNRKTIFVIMVLLFLAISLVSFVMVKSTLTSAFSPKSLHSIYIKIFTNYLQLIIIVTQFELEWPTYVIEFFNFQRAAGTVYDQVFLLDCIIELRNSGDVENVYYSKLLVISALPILIVVISYIFWISYGSLKESYKYLKREAFTTIIVLFFLVYPIIVRFMFSNFSCIKIDKIASFLNENTSIECWDSNHKRYSFILVIPSIILWALGAPTLLLLLMTKNRKRLHLDFYRVVYGFLYNGYKQNRFYWEINIMFRKVMLISVTVFKISQANALQALNFFLLMFISMFLQYYFKPYHSTQLNRMEMQALNIAAFTIYFGLYYLSKSTSEELKIFLFIFIILGNGFFLIYWIYYMSLALVRIFVKFFPKFRSFLKFGDAFEEEFYEEEINRKGVYMNKFDMKKAYTFTNLNKKNEDNEELKYRSIVDAYIDVAKRDIGKIDEFSN